MICHAPPAFGFFSEKGQQKTQTLLHPGFWSCWPDSNWRRPAAARLPPAPIKTRFAREVASSNNSAEKAKSPGHNCIQDLMELLARFELATSSLPRMRSTY